MYKKWKSVAALGMAVLIGCIMPVDTMIVAAEEYQEAGETIEVNSASDDEAVLDDEKAGDEENVDDKKVSDETDTDENEDENPSDEADEDNENTDDGISADEDEYVDDEIDIGNYGIALMAEAGDIVAPASIDAPKIEIKWNGEPYTYDLGDTIDFKYVNINKVDQAFECSASQAASLFYCLERVKPGDKAKVDWQMDDNLMSWQEWQGEQPSFEGDYHYVLYVKAVGEDGQITYARSGGIAVDTHNPVVTGVEDGKSYLEGETFNVDDKNLESVTVNDKPVTPELDGSYKVSANGTACVIKAMDKAGNETICSINVSRNPADNVIRESGIYSLKEGTSYKLAEGQWQVGGDKSVYSGGITFYVEAGVYTFTKR